MDAYLNCLYQYLSNRPRAKRLLGMAAYRPAVEAREASLAALEEILDPQQLQALETYHRAELFLFIVEEEALFEEAVLLGRWMAAPQFSQPLQAPASVRHEQ